MSFMMNLDAAFFITWLAAGVQFAGPVLLASLGEILGERAGVLNIGIEGTVLLGALGSYLVAFYTGLTWLGFFAGGLTGLLVGCVLAFFYVGLGSSQVVVGIIFNVLAAALASYIYMLAIGNTGSATITMLNPVNVPYLKPDPRHRKNSLPATLAALSNNRADDRGTDRAVPHEIRTLLACSGRKSPCCLCRRHQCRTYSHHRRFAVLLRGGPLRRLSRRRGNRPVSGRYRERPGLYCLGHRHFRPLASVESGFAALVFGLAYALQLSLQLYEDTIPAQVLLVLPYLLTILAMSGVIGKAAQPLALTMAYRKE